MKRILTTMAAALAVACACTPAMAQQDPTPPMLADAASETRPLADALFRTLQSGDAAKAYRDLFAGTLMEGKATEMNTLVSQIQVLLEAYGPMTGWNMFRSDCLSPTYCRVFYQVDMKSGAMFVALTLHRRGGKWMPTNIYLTDVSGPLFELP